MRKLVVLAVAAASLLALVTGQAAARTGLRASPTTSYVDFPTLELNGGFSTVVCDVLMGVTLHESVAKSAGTLAGFATINVRSCSAGAAGLLVAGRRVTGLQGPYHVNYLSFTGTLPNIQSVTLQVLEVSFWITEPGLGVTCLTASPQNITGTTTGGNPARGMEVSAANIGLEGGFGCGFVRGSMSGEGSIYAELANLNLTSVSITLI
jgi:hypothetical protein